MQSGCEPCFRILLDSWILLVASFKDIIGRWGRKSETKCCLLKELDKNCLILTLLVINDSQTINQLMFSSQLSGFLCQQLKLLNDLPTWCLVFRGVPLMTRVSRAQNYQPPPPQKKSLYSLSVTAASPRALCLFWWPATELNKMTQVALRRW